MTTEETKSAIWDRPFFGETVDQIGKSRTRAQDRPLLRALRHGKPYHLFPMPLLGDAGDLVAKALIRRGLATDEPAPILTALGLHEARAILAKVEGRAAADAQPVVNHYRCPDCGEEWQDMWSCACNDECPGCGLKDIEPYRSAEAPAAREGVGDDAAAGSLGTVYQPQSPRAPVLGPTPAAPKLLALGEARPLRRVRSKRGRTARRTRR